MPQLLPLALLACATEHLAPDAAIGGDAMLAALPADVTLVASFDAEEARGGALEELLAALGADVDVLADALGGEVARGRVGCGGAGCVVLGEGALDVPADARVRVDAHGARIATLAPARGPLRGFDGRTAVGEPVAARLLGDGKFVLGDRPAVRATYAARRGGGFDPALLDGEVPAGVAWVAVRDPARFVDQAAARAERRDGDGAAVESWLADRAAQLPVELDDIEVIAASVTADGIARLRVRCADADAARVLERALAAAAAGTPVERVVRSGRRVEAEGELGALLDGLAPNGGTP